MVTVAVAGGSGHVGKTIVATLEQSHRHNVIVLTREVKESSAWEECDTECS